MELVEALAKITELQAFENSIHKSKNKRNIVRLKKYGNTEIGRITMLLCNGKSYRDISKDMGCSVGVVHKILNKHKQDNK